MNGQLKLLFYCKGDLWISWVDGQKVFEELLLDADFALNAGNWMWLSASAYYHLYYRVYSPVAFGKKTDKDGEYIKKYVPELRKYPKDLIYEPWRATPTQQKQFGCVIGKDYPHRIVIHENVLKKNMDKMAEAYRRHKSGLAGGKFDIDNGSTVKTEPESNSPQPSTSGYTSATTVKIEPDEPLAKRIKMEPDASPEHE